MTLESLRQTELTANEREILIEDGKRWQRMGGGAHLNEWLAYGDGLMIRRRLAMKINHLNRPEGKGYAQTFAHLMALDGLEHMDKTSISAVLWLHTEPERTVILREILDTMSPGQRARLNSPITARQRVEKELKARDGGMEAKSPSSPVTILKQKLVEKEHKIAHLEERLAAADAGSLFDLKRDTAKIIGETIAGVVSPSRARDIAKAITAAINKPKPAG